MLTYRQNMYICHIRIFILYEFKLDHNAAEGPRNINKAFEDDTVKEQTIQRQFQKFRSGNMNLENKPCEHSVPVIKKQRTANTC